MGSSGGSSMTDGRNGVSAISDSNGAIRVLAIDHRDSMRRFLRASDPSSVAASEITELKADVVRALIQHASGVMLEPEFSIPQILDAGLIPSRVGVIAALEAQGYHDDPAATVTTVLDDWSPSLARSAGAAMVKLLLQYRPDSPLAHEQENVAKHVLAESERAGISLVLEPMFWGLANPVEQSAMVIETVRRFAEMSPGVLKIPFPGDGADTSVSARACEKITELCSAANVPWALLSGGGTFERFAHQLEVAVTAGCSGFMVGRALWGEAALANPTDRLKLLRELVAPRFQQLNEIVDKN
jgi:tagatose-1,6-bisphosphate aldolase